MVNKKFQLNQMYLVQTQHEHAVRVNYLKGAKFLQLGKINLRQKGCLCKYDNNSYN